MEDKDKEHAIDLPERHEVDSLYRRIAKPI